MNEEDSIKNEIKNERAKIFQIISLWEFFRRSRAANSAVLGPMSIWPKFELVRDTIVYGCPRYMQVKKI